MWTNIIIRVLETIIEYASRRGAESSPNMEFTITGKVALITGGSSGIGYNFAKELLKQGLKGVALLDVDDVKGQAVLNEFKSEFGPDSCIFVKTDVSKQSQLEDAFDVTIQTFKHLDIVINNAGLLSENDWKKCLDVNLGGCMIGTMLAIDSYLPKYKQGSEAVIINTASITSLDPIGAIPIYSSTKAGVLGLSRAYGVKEHYEKTKVRVIAICPGMTSTNILTIRGIRQEYSDRFKGAEELPMQTPEFLATCLMDIIEKGPNGSVWVIEDTKPAYEVEFRDRQSMRK